VIGQVLVEMVLTAANEQAPMQFAACEVAIIQISTKRPQCAMQNVESSALYLPIFPASELNFVYIVQIWHQPGLHG